MDSRSIEEVIKKRERGYIWLEKDLKRNLVQESIFILAFFLAVFIMLEKGMLNFQTLMCGFAAAVIMGGALNYMRYRRVYKSFEMLETYMSEFEDGNYKYQISKGALKEGIHSQLLGQLENLGRTFDLMKEQMVDEKENTKALVTDISHQLKTPLSALKMSFELINDDQVGESEKEEFLERAHKEVKKMDNLLDSLTNLSRLEADLIQICPVEASLKETIVKAVNSLYMKAFDKKIEIELKPFEDMMIPHDPKWTGEAFVNVLDNAVKYSDPGQSIEIRVVPQITYVVIEIEDQGIGIPKSEYQNIFKRFYRIKTSRVNETEGSGVGLYLVRRILEEQGGNVRAIPGKERGTIFQMVLEKTQLGT